MKIIISSLICLFLVLTGCSQYQCYDGTYVEDPYTCYSHGGLAYRTRSLQGNWAANLTATKNTCMGVSSRLSRKLTLTQKGTTYTVNIPGTGRFTGRGSGKMVRFAGNNYKLCKVTYDVTASFKSSTSATLGGNISANCAGLYSCGITFNGTLSKTR